MVWHLVKHGDSVIFTLLEVSGLQHGTEEVNETHSSVLGM
jgi:hypothetical protein